MHPGARLYQLASETGASPRATEIAMFRECNRRMSEAADPTARIVALNRNHGLWSALLKDVGLSSNPLPPVLKQDIASLANFAMRYSTLAILQDLPIGPLVWTNDEMIEGLRGQTASVPKAGPAHSTDDLALTARSVA